MAMFHAMNMAISWLPFIWVHPPHLLQAALQRHAAAVEALERKSLAEALLEREKAIFKRALGS